MMPGGPRVTAVSVFVPCDRWQLPMALIYCTTDPLPDIEAVYDEKLGGYLITMSERPGYADTVPAQLDLPYLDLGETRPGRPDAGNLLREDGSQ